MAVTNHPLPAIRQGWVRAIVFFIVVLGIYFLVGSIAGGVWIIQHPEVTTSALINDPTLDTVVITASTLLSIMLAFVFRRFVDRQSILSMGFAWKGHQRHAWAGFLLGIVLLGIGSLILYGTQRIDWVETRLDVNPIVSGLVLFALTALSEEITFRGYMLNNMLLSMPRWPALGAVTVLFALMHLGNAHLNVVAIVNLLAGGLLLGLNYVYTRNLWFSVFFHFSWNFFQGTVLGYEVSGLSGQSIWHMERKGDDLLTGGAFGFEGSAVATGLLLLAVLFCAYRPVWDAALRLRQSLSRSSGTQPDTQ
ncbi:MAG: CPBP family intramembrane metalloprotease [Niastella sp.]|nr:CPBP family intramembrane metalloprotease [Niastella sp.]